MPPPDIIHVLIADDHPLFLKGVRAVLENSSRFRIVAEAHDGLAAWTLIQKHEPHVAVLDMDMPGLDGLQVARRVARFKSPVRLVILSMHKNEDLFRQAIDLGIFGYLLKDQAAAEIVPCLQAVAAGQHFIAPALSTYLINRQNGSHRAETSALHSLSPAQRQVLLLVSKGLTSKQIAAELGVSFRTVENHRFRIAEKLGLKGAHGLLRFALEHKDSLF